MPLGRQAAGGDDLADRTMADLGEHWTVYRDNSRYYGSVGLLADVLGPLMEVSEFRGRRVADRGAGTGRFVRILAEAGASHVTAVEPSAASSVLQRNTTDLVSRVPLVNAPVDQLAADADLEFVFSYGVLHQEPGISWPTEDSFM